MEAHGRLPIALTFVCCHDLHVSYAGWMHSNNRNLVMISLVQCSRKVSMALSTSVHMVGHPPPVTTSCSP